MYTKHTEEERLSLMKEYLLSGQTIPAFCKAHGLAANTLLSWLDRHNCTETSSITYLMKKKAQLSSKESPVNEELLKLCREKKQLEKLLEESKLRTLACETLIDLAEQTYHIRIRKNSDAK